MIKLFTPSSEESSDIEIDDTGMRYRFRSSGAYTAWKYLVSKINGKTPNSNGDLDSVTAADVSAMYLEGNEDVGGAKEFTSNPRSSGPQGIGDDDLVKKSYADDNVGLRSITLAGGPYTKPQDIFVERDYVKYMTLNIYESVIGFGGEYTFSVENLGSSEIGAYHNTKAPFGGYTNGIGSAAQYVFIDNIELWANQVRFYGIKALNKDLDTFRIRGLSNDSN